MLCEKTPLNILNVEEIRNIFDNQVKFINIIRDGRDVVASYHPRFGYMVKPELWKRCIIEANKFKGTNNFLSIRYEDLVNDKGAVMNQLKQYLNLSTPFDAENWLEKTSIKGYIKSPVNNNLGTSIVNSDINVASLGNWKKSDSPYVNSFLTDDECVAINKSLGYE